MSKEPSVWPPNQSPKITKTSSEDCHQACPYLLSKHVLGAGSFSHVFECKNKNTGSHYAAKQYTKKLVYGMESSLQSEFQILKQVSFGHKNILSLVDYFETEDHFYLVTDLALGNDLFERITTSSEGKLSSCETRDILGPLLSALAYLHSNQIIHRDIKAENVLFTSRSSKPSSLLLADFGLALLVKDGEHSHSQQGGTLSYMAPECLTGNSYSFPIDMWAVGVLTYFMLCGYMPFDCDTDKETTQLIKNGDFIFEPAEYWTDVPDSAKDFISQCFKVNPEDRITAAQALSHSFVLNTPLKRSPSSISMSQLQAAVWKLHSLQSLSSSTRIAHLSSGASGYSSFSSRLSLDESCGSSVASTNIHRLLGDRCYSPDTISHFCTPLMSSQVSPVSSQTNLHKPSKVEISRLSAASPESEKVSFII
ncbi:hypothetical protein FT663_01082 [Candidozyma haemuli var. vulneris]|uniref:Protein kinase domain-containing protein n=1 Tax=Candidozyma haemuli TaxID=45357 RepID=A0A2V1ATG1_9ASCO|nr:hypothetical protein CXQ85_000447 [[Candida] haemuloni]KAF3986098.1 hypothetical protein FT662_04755 [[Candida] haemuloni var. vulneris]KAF3994852.1 hypothetical protein FT663_01082 [[Candida] haemuloni var. vulneris]PVH21467.1 hypothetical protein CXQ85_000447 [[Candida] haemuloni]